jgi:hypothetical protein
MGVNTTRIWESIKDIVVKTIIRYIFLLDIVYFSYLLIDYTVYKFLLSLYAMNNTLKMNFLFKLVANLQLTY